MMIIYLVKIQNYHYHILLQHHEAFYIEYSTKIYEIYLKYVSVDDMHVYSIDEVFIDITSYLKVYNVKPPGICKNDYFRCFKNYWDYSYRWNWNKFIFV